jgi:hypothetical protein
MFEHTPLSLLKHGSAVLEENSRTRRDNKIQQRNCEKNQENGNSIVLQLSFVVHFSAACFPRFTCGNSAATLGVKTSTPAAHMRGTAQHRPMYAPIAKFILWRSRDYD